MDKDGQGKLKSPVPAGDPDGEPIVNRAILVVIALALSTAAFAGCLGDDDINTDIPRAVVKVTEVADQEDTFLFDATGSTGKGLKFEWSFGDGATGSEAKETHTYSFGSAVYTAELLVTDLNGVTDRWSEEITVGNGENGPPIAAFQIGARHLGVGEPLTVDASATTDPEGDPIRYEWDFNAVMTKDEYIAFKDNKMHQADLPEDDGPAVSGDNTGKSSRDLPDPQRILDDPDRLTQKSPGDHSGGGHPGSGEWDVSLFEGRRTSTEPRYTLEGGFTEPAVYVVLLTAYDVKGASREIVSQDAWAVEVVETKKKLVYAESTTGTFNAGSQSTVTDNTPDDEVYRDQMAWPFEIPDPIDIMFINVTWSQNAVYENTGQVNNDVDVVVVPPSGSEIKALGPDEGHQILLNTTAAPAGEWTVKLSGRQGANIEYTVEVWAKVDLNPFRDIEAEHH